MLFTLPGRQPEVVLAGPDDAGFWQRLGQPPAGRYALLLGDPADPGRSLVLAGTLVEIVRYLDPARGALASLLADLAADAHGRLSFEQARTLWRAAPSRRPAPPPPAEPLVPLPHTGLLVPDHSLGVTGYQELEMARGVAFTATLRQLDTVAGTVENRGIGGATTFVPVTGSPLTHRDLRAYADRCRTASGGPVDEQTLLDALIEEAEISREVAACQEAGAVLLRLVAVDGPDACFGGEVSFIRFRAVREAAVASTLHRTRLVRQLLADAPPGPGQWWQYWTGIRWADLTGPPTGTDG
ncbi:hypothetical protein WEI85_19850 [Actinomycetes bacterium KLBMP 9797]